SFVGDEAMAEESGKKKGRGKEKEPPKPKPTRIKEPKPVPVLDPLEAERRANRRPNRSLVVRLVAALVILAGAAFVVLVLPNMVRALSIRAPVAAALTSVSTALTDSKFNGVKADLVGDTFQATICDKAGPAVQGNLVRAMDVVAREAATIKDSVKAAGVVIISCSNANVTILHAVAPIDAVVSYVSGNMSNKQAFWNSWQKQ